MPAKNFNGVKKSPFRKGDLVRQGSTRIGMVLETWAWYLTPNHIDVRFKGGSGTGSIVDIKELKLVRKREDIKKFWNYIY